MRRASRLAVFALVLVIVGCQRDPVAPDPPDDEEALVVEAGILALV